MTTTFEDRKPNQCCAPVSGEPGPRMEVCGEPVKPGTSYCAAHHARFFYTLAPATAMKASAGIALRSNRQQRMTHMARIGED